MINYIFEHSMTRLVTFLSSNLNHSFVLRGDTACAVCIVSGSKLDVNQKLRVERRRSMKHF